MTKQVLIPFIIGILSIQFTAPMYAQAPTISAPQGMTFIPGGNNIIIGSDDGLENERPAFNTQIPSFFIDYTPVTVGQFRLFVKINRYISDAEKKGAAPVYNPNTQVWDTIPGAYWEYPWGRDSTKAPSDIPVTQVSWNDAKAYANWVKKRLPTEYELERAAQLAGAKSLKFLDGRVWQWSDSWFSPYDAKTYYTLQLNREKTLKGGLIFPDGSQSEEYRASIRTSALPNFFSSHTGFRCAAFIDED